MLGPLTGLLEHSSLAPEDRTRLEVAQRNSLRLLKLVDSLLDFARSEAGRVEAVFEEIDVSGLTVELTGNFRSACERAGLRLVLDCPPIAVPTYVDRDM